MCAKPSLSIWPVISSSVGKTSGGRRALRAERFLAREAERADAGENFQPGEEEPAERAEEAEEPAAGDVINGEKRGGQNAEARRPFVRMED